MFILRLLLFHEALASEWFWLARFEGACKSVREDTKTFRIRCLSKGVFVKFEVLIENIGEKILLKV
jgi:hypothetical protein